MISLMSDDASPPDDVLSGLPRTRPQHRSAKRAAARTKAAAKAKPAAVAGVSRPKPKPKAVVAPAPEQSTPRPVYTPPPRADDHGPSGAELAATAVQAAGELVELGGRVLKGVLRRLPKP